MENTTNSGHLFPAHYYQESWPVKGPNGETWITRFPHCIKDAANRLIANGTWKSLDDEINYCVKKAELWGNKGTSELINEFEFLFAKHVIYTVEPKAEYFNGRVSYYDLLVEEEPCNVIPFRENP